MQFKRCRKGKHPTRMELQQNCSRLVDFKKLLLKDIRATWMKVWCQGSERVVNRAVVLKGDKEDLTNYRPITLLPVLYKVFTRCLLARIRRTLEEAQPVEQAGFRRKFSTLDHIATCRRLIEVAREHRMPLVLTFVDYKKAFDSVEPKKVWEALEEQGVEKVYIDVLRECYTGCTTTFRPFFNDVVVPIEKGVRQGDPISPNLFSACLESVIRRCDWSNFGWNIDGILLNHLRFADDVVLITSSPEEASEMLNRLDQQGNPYGLTMNTSKTKVMRNPFAGGATVMLKGNPIEDVEEYVYLGSQLNMRNDLSGELTRRCKAGWAAFNSIKSVVEDTKSHKLRADLFNTTVLPALSYAGETWALTKAHEKRLKVIQASIERRLVGLTLSRQRELKLHNSDVRAISKIKDIVLHVDEAKHRFAGHVMRRNDGRWSSATTRWYPRDKKRPPGRPPLRWADSLAYRNNVYDQISLKVYTHWTSKAQNRDQWKRSWDPRKGNRRAEERVA